jgi:hypothetical protein
MRSPDFFVFGCERSGTTLLCALLSERPEICVVNDSFVYNVLNNQGWARKMQLSYKALSRLTGSLALLSGAESSHLPPIDRAVSPEQARQFVNDLLARYKRRADGNWLIQYAERLEAAGDDLVRNVNTYRDLLDTVLTELVPEDQRQKKLLGEKTPIHSHMQEWLRASYPGARSIVLLRHPITNVAAIFKRRQSAHGFRESIDVYRSYYEVALSRLLRADDVGVTVIRYEDLVASPQETLGGLTKSLGATDGPISDTFHYYVKQSYVGERIEPSRDLELRSLLDDRQQQQVLDDCKGIVDRFYPE